MSKTKFVEYCDRGFWAYDVGLGVFLKYLIDAAEPQAVRSADDWLAKAISSWRVCAVVSDYGLEIEETWSVDHLATFVNIADQACQALAERESIFADEIVAWPILKDLQLHTRGAEEVATAPAIELGRAVIALVDGTLPEAAVGTWWLFGTPEGRQTIGKRE